MFLLFNLGGGGGSTMVVTLQNHCGIPQHTFAQAGGRDLILVLAGTCGLWPHVSRCAKPKAWGAKEAPGLPYTWLLHMGAAHVVVCPGIWYALGIDPAISRVLSACPTAGLTATIPGGREEERGGGGGWHKASVGGGGGLQSFEV